MNGYVRMLAMLACCGVTLAVAQSEPKLETIDEVPPPPAGAVTNPNVTVRTEGGTRFEEYRIKGRLYMIKVTPQVGASYYLVDEKGEGMMQRHDSPTETPRTPSWVIKSW